MSLADAIERGLQHNLGVILGEQGRAAAEASRRRVLSELLPRFNGQMRENIQQVNLAAFGFSGFPGVPELVGPFSVFDARVTASQSLVDLRALRNFRAAGQQVEAVRYSYQNTRDLVVLVVAALYLQALAGKSRIDAVQAELQFAATSYNHAVNLKSSGLLPAIDVLRAQVQRQSVEQRLIVAENDFEKDKLTGTCRWPAAKPGDRAVATGTVRSATDHDRRSSAQPRIRRPRGLSFRPDKC